MLQFTARPTTIIIDYLGKHDQSNKSQTRTEINCNDVLRQLPTYSSTTL